MHADGYIWACGFFQKIEFADDAAIMKVWSHLGAICVLVEEARHDRRCFLAVGIGL